MAEVGPRSKAQLQKTIDLPRFGIMDMLVLTAAMAVVFAFRNKADAIGWGFQTEVIWFKVLEHVCFCLYFALPLAAIYRFVANKKAAGKYLESPGHWLLLAALCIAVGRMFSMLVMQFGGQNTIDDQNVHWYLGPFILATISSMVILIRGIKVADKWWWPSFAALTLLNLTQTVSNLLLWWLIEFDSFSNPIWQYANIGISWAVAVSHALVCLGLIAVTGKEILLGPRRDFWHWVGALLPFIACLFFPLLNWIYVTYLFDPSIFQR